MIEEQKNAEKMGNYIEAQNCQNKIDNFKKDLDLKKLHHLEEKHR